MHKYRQLIPLTIIIIFFGFIYWLLFSQMPKFDRQQIFSMPKSSSILDSSGNELFRFYDEDRRWVNYENISPHMINAIIVTEDRNFRTNNGIDNKAIARAAINNISKAIGNDVQLQGASTITQQLVKNIFLTNKKTLKRKIQETILAQKLTRTEINLADGESRKEKEVNAKKSIISMYLNYVFFGNKSYGIESASQNFFKKKASNLSILESSILASLPQAPSLYNPVVDTKRVLGHRYIIQGTGHSIHEMNEESALLSGVYNSLESFPLLAEPENCLDELRTIGSRTKANSGSSLQAIYFPGRKDHVLCQLYEHKHISWIEMKDAWRDAKKLSVHQARLSLQAPHFVYWIKQKATQLPVLRNNGIDHEQLIRQGYTIHTTLDETKQEMAQGAVENYMGLLKKNGGNNRALLHIDSSNGDVLSYIGSHDFYDIESEGQNDNIISSKQVGSTLKPFFYSYLFTHFEREAKNIIGDFPIPGGPSNYDNIFWGKISIGRALGSSRNLPAVRIFIALGKDKVFVNYLRQLGFLKLDRSHEYNYPLALGAGEHDMTELAGAYAQLSTTGERYHSVNPIKKIVDPYGTVVYDKENDQKALKKMIPDAVGQMIRDILSAKEYMPIKRRGFRSLALNNFGLKTGTSDRKIGKVNFPKDARMVLYTPEDVIVTRAGNTNGHAMGEKAFGGEMNYYVMRQYIYDLQRKNLINDIPRTTNAVLPERKELTQEELYMLWGG